MASSRTLDPLIRSGSTSVSSSGQHLDAEEDMLGVLRNGRGLAHLYRALLRSVPLLFSDLVALVSCTLLSWMTLAAVWPGGVDVSASVFVVLSVGLVAAHAMFGLYPGTGLHGVVELRRTTIATLLLFLSFVLATWLRGGTWGFRLMLIATCVGCIVATPAFRAMVRSLLGRSSWWSEPLLVLADGPGVRRIIDYFASQPQLGLTPISPLKDGLQNGSDGVASDSSSESVSLEQVTELAVRHRAFWAALPLREINEPDRKDLVRVCSNVFPRLLLIPDMHGAPSLRGSAINCGGVLGIEVGRSLLLPGPRTLKQIMDSTLAGLAVFLCIPLAGFIAAAIKLTSAGPVFYSQQRIGKGGRSFAAMKFRTMHVHADKVLEHHLANDAKLREEWDRDHKLKNDPRVTRIGKWLRKTSLDELPQLWNVLRGDMSLVGPRPIVTREIPRYGESFKLYLSVEPGMTGLWQVSGRNRLPYAERVRLDSFYAQNWSPWLDLYILGRTINVVLRGDGV